MSKQNDIKYYLDKYNKIKGLKEGGQIRIENTDKTVLWFKYKGNNNGRNKLTFLRSFGQEGKDYISSHIKTLKYIDRNVNLFLLGYADDLDGCVEIMHRLEKYVFKQECAYECMVLLNKIPPYLLDSFSGNPIVDLTYMRAHLYPGECLGYQGRRFPDKIFIKDEFNKTNLYKLAKEYGGHPYFKN